MVASRHKVLLRGILHRGLASSHLKGWEGGTGSSPRAGGIPHAAHMGWQFLSSWEVLDVASAASCVQLGHRCAAAGHTHNMPMSLLSQQSEVQARNWMFLGSVALFLKAHPLKETVLAQMWDQQGCPSRLYTSPLCACTLKGQTARRRCLVS